MWTLILVACSNEAQDVDDVETEETEGVPILGDGSHDVDDVVLSLVTDTTLSGPTDLEISPVSGNLWVTNQVDSSITIIADPGEEGQSQNLVDDNINGLHFLARPAALAFGEGGVATIHDTDEYTQGQPPNGTPQDFMGPTLWTSDENEFDGGHHGHLDMLHNSPLGKGIAWDSGNAFWVFDGYHRSITLYDFNDDHGLGGADHSDGEVARYVEGQVELDPELPSHLALDADTGLLYIADTGNNRIAVLDTSEGSAGQNITPNYDGTDQYRMEGATLTTLIDGEAEGLSAPSGLELFDGRLFVTDPDTSTIYAFELDGTSTTGSRSTPTGWAASPSAMMAVCTSRTTTGTPSPVSRNSSPPSRLDQCDRRVPQRSLPTMV